MHRVKEPSHTAGVLSGPKLTVVWDEMKSTLNFSWSLKGLLASEVRIHAVRMTKKFSGVKSLTAGRHRLRMFR